MDDSEFVEVDPTGRYGRVIPLSFSLFLALASSYLNSFLFDEFFIWCAFVLGSTTKFSAKELQR